MVLILISLIVGAAGGTAVGKDAPRINMGLTLNALTGLVGGGVLGYLFTCWLPGLSAAASAENLSMAGIIVQAVGGLIGGSVLTTLVGFLKNKMS